MNKFEQIEYNQNHDAFLRQVELRLVSMGCITERYGYHDLLSHGMCEYLSSNRNDFTSLAVRGSPDLLVVHKPSFKAFYVDVKTDWLNRGTRNLVLESYAFMKHLNDDFVNERCLYVFKDFANNFECAFWALPNQTPDVARIMIPMEQTDEKFEKRLRELLEVYFSPKWGHQIPIIKLNKPTTVGSPDAFVLMPYDSYKEFPKMEEVIHEYISQ